MKKAWIIFSLVSLFFFNCNSSNDDTYPGFVEEEDKPANVRLGDQSGVKIPIIAWGGIRQNSSVSMYKDMADAGFTINYSYDLRATPRTDDIPRLFTALDRANEANIQQMVGASWLDFLDEKNRDRLINHPALAGYFFHDEPTTYEWLDSLSRWVERVQQIDNEHFSYINLAGCDCRGANWAPELIGCTDVEPSPCANFVRTFADNINTPMISVDRYTVNIDPSTKERVLMPGWYYTLELMSREARRTGKDLWSFALSTEHSVSTITYPIPTVNDLRLQMYSNLAYGAQVLQYYTYIVYSTSGNYGQAPLDANGNKTSTWYLIQEMNQEFQALAPVFLNAKVNWTAHTGEIPDGCIELEPSMLPPVFKSLEITEGNGALVSFLEKGEDNFLAVVNHDIVGNIKVKATGNGNLYRLNREAIPQELGKQARVLTPGDICIFFWKD
jgi:hypothetical protein